MIRPTRPINAIFGRGGVRCIALAGAVTVLEEEGYELDRVAGVSAGSIIAALVAAGYTAAEIRRIVWTLDYAGFRDAAGTGRIPVLGPALALLTRRGLYRGDALFRSVRSLLARRGIHTFADLPARDPDDGGSAFRLHVVAADITRQRIVVLPEAATEYGVDPGDLEVARALRMSMGMPLVFEPRTLGTGSRRSILVDGGLLAGVPFALLEPMFDADRPTLGLLASASRESRRAPIRGPLSLLKAAYYTALLANDVDHRSPDQQARTIEIDCGQVSCVDFPLSDTGKAALYERGRATASRFVARQTRTGEQPPELSRIATPDRVRTA